jgi:hypothetical protein
MSRDTTCNEVKTVIQIKQYLVCNNIQIAEFKMYYCGYLQQG